MRMRQTVRTAEGLFGGWMEKEQGSFTFEATLVYPAVLLATLAMIFFALYIYGNERLYHEAVVTAERAAFTWDNTHKDPLTGAFAVTAYDGLYWRTFKERSFDIFHLFFESDTTSIVIPRDAGRTDLDTVGGKLMKAASFIEGVEESRLAYERKLFERIVNVRLSIPFHRPGMLAGLLAKDRMLQEANARIVDPAEFIRLTDFTRLYASELKRRISKEDAKRLMAEPEEGRPPQSFRGHDIDLVPYLKQLVNGMTVEFPVPGEKKRIVDALDKSDVAHQAICTYNQKNLLSEQSPKDAYLLRQGSVKGVVWHFFTNCRGKQPKPSAALQRELQRNGIVVVIHD